MKTEARKRQTSDTAKPASGISPQKEASESPRLQTPEPKAEAEVPTSALGEESQHEEVSSVEESDGEQNLTPKRRGAAKRSTTKSKGSMQISDKVAHKIKSLKAYVVKCGVRKNWRITLADLGPRQQVKKLTQILEELGVEGRPTNEKCKAVAARVALKRETEGLDLSNIIEEERRPRRARPSINYSKFDAPSPAASDKEATKETEESSESEDEWAKGPSSDDEPSTRRRRSRNIISASEDGVRSEEARSAAEASEPEELSEAGNNKGSPVNISEVTLDPETRAEAGSDQVSEPQVGPQPSTKGATKSPQGLVHPEAGGANDTKKLSPSIATDEVKLALEPQGLSEGLEPVDPALPHLASPPVEANPGEDVLQVGASKDGIQSQPSHPSSPAPALKDELAETLFASSE